MLSQLQFALTVIVVTRRSLVSLGSLLLAVAFALPLLAAALPLLVQWRRHHLLLLVVSFDYTLFHLWQRQGKKLDHAEAC